MRIRGKRKEAVMNCVARDVNHVAHRANCVMHEGEWYCRIKNICKVDMLTHGRYQVSN